MVPVEARRIDIVHTDGIPDGYTVTNLQGAVEQGSSTPSFIRHSFVFDPDPNLNIFLFFLPQPITFDVLLTLTASATCSSDANCAAIARAFDSASVRLTGDYVSLGGVTYAGLAEGPESGVPEPGSFALLGGGLVVAVIAGFQLRLRRAREGQC